MMQGAEQFTHSAYPFFTATLIVGLLSMALIQVLKDLLPIRRWFQQHWVRQWLGQRSKLIADRTALPDLGTVPVEKDLVQLAADGDAGSLYNLPIEQLCGQLNAAAQAVLDHPKEHEALLWLLAAKAEKDDVSTVLDCSATYREQSGTKLEGPDLTAFTRCVDARNRVAHQVQRAIDALQLSAGNRWKLCIQNFAIALSGMIAVIWECTSGEGGRTLERIEVTLAVAILGGFIAPIGRDLLAALQSARK
jgi:hypothetical protein